MARTKIFKSGNSAAVRLPARFAPPPGTLVEVREEAGRWVIEAVPAEVPLINLDGIWGSCPGIKPIASEDRVFDERPSTILAREQAAWEKAERERGD
ncbi:MAG: AbrB/MazE/SpoVT family DNA-binding domain-containing protein [Sphingomonadales bacterium]|jgi:antitoxin VapB